MGVKPFLEKRWLALMLWLAFSIIVSTVGAQDGGGLLAEASNTPISLANPFTGEGYTVTLLRFIYVAGGAVLLFAGWSAYQLALSMAGFAVGASIGAGLAASYGQFTSLIVSLVLGVLGAGIASFIYLLAVTLVGGYMGLLLAGQLLAAFGLQPQGNNATLIYALAIILGAGLAIALAVELTIILTSAIGAVMLAGGSGLVGLPFGVLGTLLLFIVGVIVQIQFARSRNRNPFKRRQRDYSR